ncbi:hypothetical protein RBH94_11950 [Aestuariibaculum sp. YM273]|uniref:hypothetical protein n=1 Tax=Aestuariibaculum sp. YM273 TaxID=3070659 RepID=UPI0027DC4E36|nr:hypothetical protein [Aestuariibaculum sp. YM273]WMI64771.1 hypothetical protein RBH94_11950 [Aestuariibaculum sp. YM273]
MKNTEICQHCGGDYIPKRRGTQKFCSNSCRSRYWYEKQPQNKVSKKNNLPQISEENLPTTEVKPASNPQEEKMNFAGVGNAAAGAAIVEIGKKMFTSTQNRPATKKDIQELKDLLTTRYFPIHNLPYDQLGKAPYFDIETGHVEYFHMNNE